MHPISMRSWRGVVASALLLGAGCAAATQITITEFYNTTLHHYVLITDPNEVAAILRGDAGPGWQRTGATLSAYSAASDAPSAVAVCRFYGNVAAGGPNSHFYTADPAECAAVKQDPGWHYEGIAFYVTLRTNGQCGAGQQPVWRAYNNGYKPQQGINDGNHRFSVDRQTILNLVSQGWNDEGVVFCVPGGTGPVTLAPSGNCMIPVPGFDGKYRLSNLPSAALRLWSSGTAGAPVANSTMSNGAVTLTAATPYQIAATPSGKRMSWSSTHTETTGPGLRIVEDLATPQALNFPMQPGEAQSNSGTANATITVTAPGTSCTGTITGTYQTTYTFVGMDSVTVAGGTFSACRFNYDQTMSLHSTCGDSWGGGASTDHVTMWFVEGLGMVKNVDNGTGAVTELISYTH